MTPTLEVNVILPENEFSKTFKKTSFETQEKNNAWEYMPDVNVVDQV